MRRIYCLLSVVVTAMLLAGLFTSCDPADEAPPGGTGVTVPERADLDILYVGAHPDDEAFNLATFGQWNELQKLRIGVVTLTRGEGGGNALGPEEGPPLGLLREAEERRAVGMAGIEHIYYLDKVDFYYTVSAPLTESVWEHEPTLEKLVRIVRATRPSVIITMDPSPTPGNHGHHQYAARLAVEAYGAAANPGRFPSQIADEGLASWRAGKLFRWYYGPPGVAQEGPDCASTFVPTEPTDEVFGVWTGQGSDRWGKTWAAVARDAQREYASQGWAVWSDAPTDPGKLGCQFYTLIDSRVPYTSGSTETTAVLEGALRPAAGGLPLGTELYLTADRFHVVGGQPFNAVVHVLNGGTGAWTDAGVEISAPSGWTVEGSGALGAVEPGKEGTASFVVTPSAGAALGRYALGAALRVGETSGQTREVVEIVPAVRGALQPLAHVDQFRSWATEVGVPQLDNLIKARLSLGLGETRTVGVDLHNFSRETQSGAVSLELPQGFSATPATLSYDNLAPDETRRVTLEITSTDTTLETSNEGPGGGDYDIQVITGSQGAEGTQRGALNLVPVSAVPEALVAPAVDGQEGANEYSGLALDLGRLWEGDPPSSAADASGSARVTWSGDALYLVVHVTDDVLGTVLPRSDAKRHWRTDSVEIAIDPRGGSENTATTFKVGVFPTTEGGGAAAYRDADNHQGPVEETAPGLEVASRLTSPYAGYTIEVKIPFAVLPVAPDPERMTLNVFIYDSDTEDKTGQTRLGWSTWEGVQGDPYRWGHTALEGYQAPSGPPSDPIMPLNVARSVTSPQSLLQSSEDGIAPGAEAAAREDERLSQKGSPRLSDEGVHVTLEAAGSGEAHVFVWTDRVVAKETKNLEKGAAEITLPIDAEATETVAASGVVVVGWQTESGRTAALKGTPPRVGRSSR